MIKFLIFFALIFCLATPAFSLMLLPQKDGNYTIIDDRGKSTRDVSEKYIRDNYKKYKSQYWATVNVMLNNSKAYRWNRGNLK